MTLVIAGLGGERPYLHLDLSEPDLDFVSIARGFGVEAERVETPEALALAVKKAFDSGKPWLLDAVVDGSI